MLFFIVFLLFSVLIFRLGEIQIVFGDDFKREIERTEDITVSNPVPRGKMFDRSGQVIVDNTPLNAITYTKYQNTSQKEMVETADKLAEFLDIDTKKVRDRDKKDYWIIKNPKAAKKLITKKEWKLYDDKKWEYKKIYQLQLERIPNSEIDQYSKQDIKAIAIFKKMNSGYALAPQIIKNKDVSAAEFAAVSENLESLPGVDTTTDWDRKYVFGDTLKTILGNVSSSEEGLPKESLDKYMAKDYSRNDRVGKSYLEYQYEDVLHGQKAKVNNKTDKAGNVLSQTVVSEGQRGKDLVLTVDAELQKKVEKIIEEEMWKAKRQYGSTGLLDRAFVVLMDPHSGEILSLAGKQLVRDKDTGRLEMQDYAQGTFTTSYNVGSAVKGATVLTGYQTGAIQPGTVLKDEPIKIANTPVKKSWKTFGSINDLRALQVSSNVYMFKTAIKIAKGNYVPNQSLWIDTNAFNTIRRSFSQFGLGVRTGIDLPNEMTGFPGSETLPGKLMDLAIGQYDTYTPIQLAQYVSTIANGGNRMQPHIVKEIREPVMDNNTELGPIIEEIQPKVLNRLEMKDEWIKRVQQGFHMVMQVGDGTAVSYFKGKSYDPAGKTGTAQAFYYGSDRSRWGTPVMNLSLVTFAPYNNPEVAMAVVVPWAYQGSGPALNHFIGERVMDAYFNLKKERKTDKGKKTEEQNTDNNTQTQE
ncbi:peptidoglycan D,D-transpeptidase FtsI family protein [Bacillus rubiinfantis]|uniref:peptidoglycan D,D-transpeptidase FtsI family protein n=1 Tax=Bacillus rubiinfantis TaxID=1499680 RepID=UPI001FE4A2E8|nr:penicillin-binding protein 2 [Bacillus rubiinfantis]